jgi:putative glutamine amidotransferase
VEIEEGTRLRDILKRGMVSVNSFHHQAIGRLGDGLVVSARSSGDQLVEGVEVKGRRFVLGVQWHPEAFWNREDGFQALFEALVSTSRP